jgi:maltooligosyltrehalose trehalohydrolase
MPSWGLPPAAFVCYLQNHDQVANSARGLRGHQLTSPGRWRAMTALTLLMPATPLLFQGQEFAASSPFLYFADFEPALAAAVRKGRGEFLTQFPSIVDFEQRSSFDDPADPATFDRSKLDLSERQAHAGSYRMHVDLLRLRREKIAFSSQGRWGIDGAVLSSSAFALRFFTPDHRDDRLLIVNLGADLHRPSIAEPLVAPPVDSDWSVEWSSEDPTYGGIGTPDIWPSGAWYIPGQAAIVLAPGARRIQAERRRQRRTA